MRKVFPLADLAARTASAMLLFGATAAAAQEAASPTAPAAIKAAPLSADFALRLVELLVKKGQLTQSEADVLVAEASSPSSTSPDSALAAETRQALRDEPGAIVVPYIPESVRKRIKDELRAEMTADIQSKGLVAAGEVVPPWTKAIRLSGDFRARAEGIWFGNGNNAVDAQGNPIAPVNFAAINAGTGFNVNNGTSAPGAVFVNPPFINSTEQRRRARIRARLALDARVDDWITFSARLATGNDNNPVSTNQTLGSPGQLSKYAIWLDRAGLRFTPTADVQVDLGRFANPFWTGEMMFDGDLNFDGIALGSTRKFDERLGVFASLGAFPIFNTDLNFGTNNAQKFRSADKYLLAAQVGVEFTPVENVEAKLAVGFFDFTKVQGRRSSPCFVPVGATGTAPVTAADSCDTDATRPAFQQFGNTLFVLRDLVITDPTAPQLQYFGLASKYRVLNVRGQVGFGFFDKYRATITGEYLQNLAFSRSQITRDYIDPVGRGGTLANPQQDLVVNNFGPTGANGLSTFAGSGTAWSAGLLLGSPKIERWLDWGLGFEYRHVGTDAMVDGFVDSNFHRGGTNAKGYILTGSLGVARNTLLQARWLSADVVTGPRYSNDVLFVDLIASF